MFFFLWRCWWRSKNGWKPSTSQVFILSVACVIRSHDHIATNNIRCTLFISSCELLAVNSLIAATNTWRNNDVMVVFKWICDSEFMWSTIVPTIRHYRFALMPGTTYKLWHLLYKATSQHKIRNGFLRTNDCKICWYEPLLSPRRQEAVWIGASVFGDE